MSWDFVVPVTSDDLLKSGAINQYVVQSVLSPKQLPSQLHSLKAALRSQGPLCILEHFDTAYSVLQNFRAVDVTLKENTLELLIQVVQGLSVSLPPLLLSGSWSVADRKEQLNAVKMSVFLLCKLTEYLESDSYRESVVTAPSKWDGLFYQELRTQEQSLVFVKRMLVLAVSSVTYLRGIFPEDAYRSRYLEDLCIKVLKEDCTSPGACKIVKWLMGCFDALEKRYLQIVLIGVHRDPDDTNHVIESYQFKFKYTDHGPQMAILRNENIEMSVTMEDTKKASVLLIRKLFLLMQNLDALPDDVYLTMKLYYYDDATPSDYEPPGFKEGVCDSLWFEGTAVHFRVGDLQTPYHVLKVGVAAEQGRVSKLQEGNYLRDSGQDMQEMPGQCREEDLPSEDESAAQFKQPRKAPVKRGGNKLAKRRKK